MTHQPHHSPQHGGSLGNNGNRSPATLIVVLVGGLVVIAGAIVVVVMMNRDKPVAPPPPQPAAVPPPSTTPFVSAEPELPPAAKVPPKADVTVTADELIEKYTQAVKAVDAGAAGAEVALKKVTDEYQGKIVEVSGQVFGTTDSDLVQYNISLGGGTERTRGVRCALADANKSQLPAIAKGQHVVIRGRCEAVAEDIILTECAVIAIKSAD